MQFLLGDKSQPRPSICLQKTLLYFTIQALTLYFLGGIDRAEFTLFNFDQKESRDFSDTGNIERQNILDPVKRHH
jgi:hypothetical protein